MFRPMRRGHQALSREESISILRRGTAGVLAVAGDEDYPYAVPMSYVYHEEKIYFHCALSGHKTDAITKNDKVSFCVIDQDMIVPKEYTTYYRSVVLFGRARILEDDAEKREALRLIAARYSPDEEATREMEIDKLFDKVCLVEIAIEHITGKEAKELVEKRRSR